jgi:DNA repair protein RadC
MKRSQKKKRNLINKTGYTPGYDTEKNPVNYIPSEDITMANTPYPVYATPLDQNGNPIGNGLVMQPGGEYKFKGASYVEEIPFFQGGGKKIYVESKNDPRYKSYQDSLRLYKVKENKFIEDKNFLNTYAGIENAGRGVLDKVRGNKMIVTEKTQPLEKGWKDAINPIGRRVVRTSGLDDNKDIIYRDVYYKKPQQEVIVKPTTTKETTKPTNVGWTPLTKEIAKSRYEGDLKNMFYRKNEKPSKYDIVYIEPPQVSRQPIKSIQNNLKPEGLIQSDIELSADMSGLRPTARQPKYYDVEDIVNNGKSQTNYKWYPENNESLRELSEEEGDKRIMVPHYQRGGKSKINPSLERQLLRKYVDPVTERAMERAKQKGIRTGIHNGGLDAIRHSSSAAATSSILPSWANALPGGLSANIAMTNLAGLAHEVNSPNSFKEHASDLYNNFVGSVVGTLPITEESKHDLLIEAQKNGILSDMGNKRPSNSRQTRPSNNKQNNMDNTTNSAFNRNIRGKKTFNQFLLGDTPEFRKGGQKSDWISDKISTLVREGYPQKQAVAIAYSMYDNVHGNGGYQLPMYQTGTTVVTDPNKPTPEAIAAYEEQQKKAQGQGITIADSALGDVTSGMTNPELMPTSAQLKSNKMQNTATNNYDSSGNALKMDNPLDVKGEQPFQFFNPYSGFDIPTAASTLGSSIESGDTFGTVASGLKLATGLARNFLGGMGQERRKNYMTQQSYEKQREGMTGAGRETALRAGGYYQEGGMQPGMEEGMEQQGQEQQIMEEVAQMLQQGADPQQVIQQLVQMGIPEEQAVQMVEAVMQEIQGSTPQLKRGGMMYYQEGGEEEEDEEGYGYEYEEEPNYMINKPSLMGKQQNFTQRELATSPAIESAVEATSSTKEEETPSYDKNSARDTWVAKTGMPWSEAKRLGYTSGTPKDNMKLLSELNDPRFKKERLRKTQISAKKPLPKKTYTNEDYQAAMRNKPKYSGNQGNISVPEEGNFITRTGEILANPLQSLSHYSKYKELPAEGFSKNNKNAHDQVIGILNPMYWANALSNAVDYAGEGEYRKAALESLDAAPAAGRLLKAAPKVAAVAEGSTAISNIGSRVANKAGSAVGRARRVVPLRNYFTPELAAGNKVIQLGQGAKRLGFEAGGYYQDGGDTYDEKDFKDNDMVRHSGGNTGLTKAEVNSLAKQYKMSPQEFLNIISYGKPGEGMSTKRELSLEGSDKYLPTNWREEYKKTKPSSTGFRGTLNRGLDYIGVEPMFYDGGYYQDGGEQQIAQQVAQAMQQGMQPQEAMAMLMESGMTEDQAIQLVQAIMEQVQQQSQQMEEATPQMRRGGEMIKRKDGSYSRRGLWDNIRDNAGSGKKPTKEMLEQEAKIKKEYQEGGIEPGADPAQEMMQQVAQMLQQGAQPEEVLQMLVEAGIPEDQAMQMVQAVMQQMQAPQDTPQMKRGGYYQDGGEEMDEQMEGGNEGAEGETPNMEQIESQVEQALQQGADPQEILQQLVQMGMPEEEAMQMIQEILQEMQGGEEEEEEGTPQMSKGGKYMRALVGKTIKNYTYNPKTDSYIVSYE